MLLMYYRLYVTHEFLGFLFELDDSNVGRNINPLEPLLAQVFRVERRRIEAEEEEIEKLFFDATEQPIQRPSSKKPRREYYSGKQKEHTIKHQIAIDETGKIQAVSHSYPGRVHDKRVYDTEQVVIPRETEAIGDLGYQGSVLTVPNKKSKGGTLSEQEKAYNRKHASERILIEHVRTCHWQAEDLQDLERPVSKRIVPSRADVQEHRRALQPPVFVVRTEILRWSRLFLYSLLLRSKSIYALHVETGKTRWSFDTGIHVGTSSPTIWNGTVYIGTMGRRLYAIE